MKGEQNAMIAHVELDSKLDFSTVAAVDMIYAGDVSSETTNHSSLIHAKGGHNLNAH